MRNEGMEKILEKQCVSVKSLVEKIDLSPFEELSRQIAGLEGCVYVCGIGKSGVVGELFSKTLLSIGVKSILLCPLNAAHGDIGAIGKRDLLCVISKSGTSDLLRDVVIESSRRGVTTAIITGREKSSLSQYSDIACVIPVDIEHCPFNLAPVTSAPMFSMVLQSVIVNIMELNIMNLDEYMSNHPAGAIGALGSYKVFDVMRRGSEIPFVAEGCLVKDALYELSAKKCGMIVIEKEGECRGVFTDGDLRRLLQSHPNPLGLHVKDVMSTSFISAKKTMLLKDALYMMQYEKKVQCVPVIDNAKCVGLLTLHDVVSCIAT